MTENECYFATARVLLRRVGSNAAPDDVQWLAPSEILDAQREARCSFALDARGKSRLQAAYVALLVEHEGDDVGARSALLDGFGDRQLLGVVANPKTGELLVAVGDDGYLQIVTLDGKWRGTGSFGGYYDLASRVSGRVRVHTAQGVQTVGGGYGTALYSALTLGAHLSDLLRWPDLPRPSDGISSFACDFDGLIEGRSDEAERWWSRAVKEFCLAERVILRTRKAALKFDGEPGCRIDTYLYRTAVERGLVVMFATKKTTLREAWGDFAGSLALAADARPLIAANWGLLARQDPGGAFVRGALEVAARSRALSVADAKDILARFAQGVSDPPARPKKARGCKSVRVTRMNPSTAHSRGAESRADVASASLGWDRAW